jgi:hypothetical protein
MYWVPLNDFTYPLITQELHCGHARKSLTFTAIQKEGFRLKSFQV